MSPSRSQYSWHCWLGACLCNGRPAPHPNPATLQQWLWTLLGNRHCFSITRLYLGNVSWRNVPKLVVVAVWSCAISLLTTSCFVVSNLEWFIIGGMYADMSHLLQKKYMRKCQVYISGLLQEECMSRCQLYCKRNVWGDVRFLKRFICLFHKIQLISSFF